MPCLQKREFESTILLICFSFEWRAWSAKSGYFMASGINIGRPTKPKTAKSRKLTAPFCSRCTISSTKKVWFSIHGVPKKKVEKYRSVSPRLWRLIHQICTSNERVTCCDSQKTIFCRIFKEIYLKKENIKWRVFGRVFVKGQDTFLNAVMETPGNTS